MKKHFGIDMSDRQQTSSLKSFKHCGSDAIFLVALLVALAVNFLHFTDFSLSIDEELASFSVDDWRVWVAQGRWGMALVQALLPNMGAIPSVPTIIFCIMLALSVRVLTQALQLERPLATVFAAFFCASPIWLHVVEFNTLALGVGIGMFATAYATFFLSRWDATGMFAAAFLVGIAAAIYQAFVPMFMALTLMLVFPDCTILVPVNYKINGRWRKVALALSSLAIALVMYWIINKVALLITKISPTYTGSYIQVADLYQHLLDSLVRISKELFGLMLGFHPIYLHWGVAYNALSLVGLLIGTFGMVRLVLTDTWGAFYSFIGIVGLFLAAGSLEFVSAGRMPVRAMLVLVPILAMLAARGFSVARVPKFLRWVLLAYAMILATWIGASLYYADRVARTRDEMFASDVARRIYPQLNDFGVNGTDFIVVGEKRFEHVGVARQAEIFGTSFFEQDGGNPYRISAYLRLLGVEGLRPKPITLLAKRAAELESMPAWPKDGCVKFVDNVLVLKLSGFSYQQIMMLDGVGVHLK